MGEATAAEAPLVSMAMSGVLAERRSERFSALAPSAGQEVGPRVSSARASLLDVRSRCEL